MAFFDGKVDLTPGGATSTPTRGRSISTPPSITPLVLSGCLPEEKKIQLNSMVISEDNTDFFGEASLDSVEAAITNVYDALSLPQVLTQVTNKFKGHTQEIDRLQQQIHEKQESLKVEEQKLQELSDDVRSTERKIYLGEDQEDQTKQLCQQHKNDLEKLLKLKNEVQEELMEKENEMEMVMARVQKYEAKMVKHVQKVNVMDEDIGIFRQVKAQCESADKLEKQKKNLEEDAESTKLLSGAAEVELHSAIIMIKETLKQMETSMQGQQQKINNCKTKQKQLQTDINVLHKRNAAQMTRLKRQVKEVHTSNKHWQEQASYLEISIQQLKSNEV